MPKTKLETIKKLTRNWGLSQPIFSPKKGEQLKELMNILSIYILPSQSFWRAIELHNLKKLIDRFSDHPILDVGCGEGIFSSLLFDNIDDGIDINVKSVKKCQSDFKNTYKRVHLMDARSLKFADSTFSTVFSNCVIEHIVDIYKVLSECYRVLKPGGILIATVPLKEMNKHLLFSGSWYIELRRRQLSHINLLSKEEWLSLLSDVGFERIEFYQYLSGKECYFWDMIDAPICLGYGRYTISAALRLIWSMLPSFIKKIYLKFMALFLLNKININTDGDYCATIIIAWKGGKS